MTASMDGDDFQALLDSDVRPEDGPFSVSRPATSAVVGKFVELLSERMRRAGHPEHDTPGQETRVVLHPIDAERTRPYRRASSATFVVAIVEGSVGEHDVLVRAYPNLVKALANLCIYLVPEGVSATPYFVTPERGAYRIDPAGSSRNAFADAIYERMAPLALSRLVIENEFVPDLPETMWEGDLRTWQLRRAGQYLDRLGLLPAPFPLEELLGERELRHVKRLFGIGGLSYGNLSTRRDEHAFWMSASGIDKSDIREVGRDVLLVTGFDPTRRAIRVSVPPHIEHPRRVSVDAIEHWMIYRRHPDVGAIVHVHAWMEGARATEIGYPCGTIELARSVAELIEAAPEPARAVVGQRNHGMTITGPDLHDIFLRIEGRLQTSVPMAA